MKARQNTRKERIGICENHTTRSGIKKRQRLKSGAGIAMSACSKIKRKKNKID